MSIWIAVIVIGLASYLFRFGPIVALARVNLPAGIDRALTYAGPSAMTALTVTAIVQHRETHGSAATIAAVLALGVGGWLALRNHSFVTAVAAGLLLYAGWLASAGLITT